MTESNAKDHSVMENRDDHKEKADKGKQTLSGNKNNDKLLASSIQGKLRQESPLLDQTCIYRVPHKLFRHNEEDFVPSLVSIGPYHHGEKKLQAMEEMKLWYLHGLIERNPNQNTSLETFVATIRSMEQFCRDCYDEKFDDLSSDRFVEMMVLDGCFIIELFHRHHLQYRDHDPILKTSWMLSTIRDDLLLLENQLPWKVAACLFELTVGEKKALLYQAKEFFGNVFRVSTPVQYPPSYCLLRPVQNTTSESQLLDIKMPVQNTPSESQWLDISRPVQNIPSESQSLDISMPVQNTTSESQLLDIKMPVISMPVQNTPSESQSLDISMPVQNIPSESQSLDISMPVQNTPSESQSLGISMPVQNISSERHLLDIARGAALGQPSRGDRYVYHSIPSVTELLEIGVDFEHISGIMQPDLLGITFENGLMRIPILSIGKNGERFVRNLIAYELCAPKHAKYYVTSYAKLFSCLIKSTKDAEFLKRKEIIQTQLSMEDIACFFTRVCKDIEIERHLLCFGDLTHDVVTYCKRRWLRSWLTKIKRDYLYNPSSIWSVSSGVFVILILTITQTIYTVLSYYK